MNQSLKLKCGILSFLLSFLTVNMCFGQSSQSALPDWAIGPFVRPEPAQPIITPDSTALFFDPMRQKEVHWEANATFNPAAAVKGNRIIVLYRAEDRSGEAKIGGHTSRIGYAWSKDGITMHRKPTPVLYPRDDNQKKYDWPGGCEDPRVAVTEEGLYVMFYTAWNHKTPRLCVATSKDLLHWQKYGPAFQKAQNGRFLNNASKSASIVTKLVNGKQIITKVNGKYLLYWGEYFVNLATSNDLINWKPMLDSTGSLKRLISPRDGYFDSDLTECGPPALITDKGILLLYNGKNSTGEKGDEDYAAGAYAAGQVLFSLTNPTKVIHRLDKPFFYPKEPYEKSGQYVDGTVFIEGMAYFHDKWFLYYGCADSRVGVAVYRPKHQTD